MKAGEEMEVAAKRGLKLLTAFKTSKKVFLCGLYAVAVESGMDLVLPDELTVVEDVDGGHCQESSVFGRNERMGRPMAGPGGSGGR